eukprot:CAMPEP_0175215502 /NCGR_PEP_ID=MMETSP0093-20121207/17248_1 /TAXON_ID=311494 /ORGANISM="Alexandrium monilatum, Strain CCMP3105" /LENGTH=418 /DNA_ID=CAMNT_0016508873 /DNA_START=205 /DNA_END=1461 /DNA_ORIENTATION=+
MDARAWAPEPPREAPAGAVSPHAFCGAAVAQVPAQTAQAPVTPQGEVLAGLASHVQAPPPSAGATGCVAQGPEVFFEAYLQVLLQLVTSADFDAWRAAWQPLLSPDFVCILPSGLVVPGDDVVLSEWRMALHWGHYNALWLSELALHRIGTGGADCRATLVRRYTTRRKGDLARDMLRLQVIALPGQDGRLRVSRHCYQVAPPKEVCGVQSHSQIAQDLWVLHHFRSVPRGFFLEVGANHAEELSNSYLLEKGAGWAGICLEPFPSGDWSLRRAELIRVAVGPDGGKLKFVAPGHILGGLVEQVDLTRVARDVPPEQQGVVEVQTSTLATILSSAQPGGSPVPRVIHYLSLDTEGSEYDILCGFPFNMYTVLSATVEHNWREPARTRIRQLLESHGFFLDASVEHDDFFLLTGYEQYL